MQERSEDPPAGVQLIVAHEIGVIALQAVENERLVSLGDLEVGESSPVGQIELCDDGLHAEARKLGVHLDVDTLVGLNAHDKLIPGNVFEDARSHVLELHADLSLLLVQSLAGLHDERHTVPTLVLDVCDQGAEGGAPRVLGHGIVLLVRGLAAIERTAVLADDDVLGLDGGDGTEDAHFLVANVLGRERDGPLHGKESQHLKQVVLHDITNDAKLVEISAAALGAKRLLEGDLNIVDVVTVPGSAEERVTKTQNQNVLHHLLAEVVVNAEELVFFPVGLQGLLQLARAG